MRELMPIDLELCRARLRYWAEDHIGYVDSLMEIFKRCKRNAKFTLNRDGKVAADQWLDKAARVSMVLASQLTEMKVDSHFVIIFELTLQNSNIRLPHAFWKVWSDPLQAHRSYEVFLPQYISNVVI